MGNGIIVKIWNIKASSTGKSASAQIGDSLKYIMNEEKCRMTLPQSAVMPEVQTQNSEGQVRRELNYVMNDIKTFDGLYIGGIHIADIRNATDDMMAVKAFYGKTDGRVALHGVVSLDEKESDPKNAGKLILLLCELMEQVYPNHQCIYAVHTNTENLHIHFVVNTVSLNGKKIHMDRTFMRQVMEPAVNQLAVKYGFPPNNSWTRTPVKDHYPIVERKMMLRADIDLAIEMCDDYDSFLESLRDFGYTVNTGKTLYLKKAGMEKGMATQILGQEYFVDRIIERIETKYLPFESKQVANHIGNPAGQEMIQYVPTVLKKYHDLSEPEKKQVIEKLRQGKNPWEERYQINWRIASASRDLNRLAGIRELIRAYSEDGSIQNAKDEIIRRQKEIGAEKKQVRALARQYKPQISLYREMQRIARKSYLYEEEHVAEYKKEYEKYQNLLTRLRSGYHKTPIDIATFLNEQKAQLQYLQAQREELSAQYKVLTKYEQSRSQKPTQYSMESLSLFEAVGHTRAALEAKKYYILTSRSGLITSKDQSDHMLRVITTPHYADGKATVVTNIEVLSKEGEIVEKIGSQDMTVKEFSDHIYRIRKEYRFYRCNVINEGTRMKKQKTESIRTDKVLR